MSSRLPARAIALAVVIVASTTPGAAAQAVLGPGDDALVLPRGVMRFRVVQQWTTFNERYGQGTPNRPDGSLEPIAIDFNLDTIGVREFPNLGPVQAGFQSLTGNPGLQLSLGNTIVNASVTVSATPIALEMGLTSRLSMGVVVPYVRTRTSIFFNANPTGTEGNFGFNPQFTGSAAARTANANVFSQFNASITTLRNTQAFCAANPAAPGCAGINANSANITALLANATAFSQGLARLYGKGLATDTVSPFIPIVGTDAQNVIEARIAGFSGLFTAFGAPAITARPVGAPSRLALDDAQRILTDSVFGVRADPLQTVERSHIGDIDIGAKFLLWDTFARRGGDRMKPSGINYRASVGSVFRLGTGQSDLPQNFVDVGTGNEGQNDIEVRGFADILIGSRFWTSFVARYNWQLADDEDVRISDVPSQRLTSFFRQRNVERDLGDISEIEINPRWVFNEYFGVMGHYFYRLKRPDEYKSVAIAVDSAVTGHADIFINPTTLSQETLIEEHRLGGGFSFSTVGAFARGRARLPLEITYLHFQTTRGYGGNAPKLFSDQIQVRLYGRILGR